MTSKLTRERLTEIAQFGFSSAITPANDFEIKELARIALAAMNGEPFAYIIQDKYERERGVEGHLSRSHVSKYVSQEDINEHEITCIPLYRHAQTAPVVQEVDADDNFYSWFGREWRENYQHNQYTTAAKQMLGVMAESAWIAATERQRQKQSVSVPDVKIYEDVPYEVGRLKTHRDCYCDGWNACRAAMLAAAPQEPNP
ncbi:TPA: hypothetical protein N2P69_000247 [Klebsiella pneumoniae]|nr:hypothetical protein [Klebsiella pneumoniae]